MTDRQQEKAFQTFIGRRKGDPKLIEIPAPRRFWERGPVIIGAILILGCAFIWTLSQVMK